MKLFSRHSQKIRFLIAGGFNTLCGYLFFASLYFVFRNKIHYAVIAVLAHVAASFQSYFTHRIFVFHSECAWLPEFIRYNVSLLTVLCLNLALLSLFIEFGGLNAYVAQGIASVATVISSYFAHQKYSFRQ